MRLRNVAITVPILLAGCLGLTAAQMLPEEDDVLVKKVDVVYDEPGIIPGTETPVEEDLEYMYLPFIQNEVFVPPTVECPAYWYPTEQNEITYRDEGVVEVNGKAFFPYGIYYLPHATPGEQTSIYTHDERVWKRAQDACINTIFHEPYSPAYFPDAIKHQMMMVPVMKVWIKHGSEEMAANYIAAADASPAFLWHYGKDEPNAPKEPSKFPKWLVYHDFFGENSSHGILINFHRGHRPNMTNEEGERMTLAEMFEGLSGEVAAGDFYIEHPEPGEIYWEVYKLNNLKRDGVSKSTFIVHPARYIYDQSFNQMAQRVFESITAGANGMVWWDGPRCEEDEVCRYDKDWDDISDLGHMVYEIMPGLTGVKPEGTESAYKTSDGIAIMTRIASDESVYVVMANLLKDDARFSLEGFEPGDVFESVFSDESYRVNKNGILSGLVEKYTDESGGWLVLKHASPEIEDLPGYPAP